MRIMSETTSSAISGESSMHHVDVPVESIVDTMRFLADLNIIKPDAYNDNGYYYDKQGKLEAEGRHGASRLTIQENAEGEVRIKATTGHERQGRYDVHLSARAATDEKFVAYPIVFVERNGENVPGFALSSKYAKRAAELVIQLVSRRLTESAYEEAQHRIERGRIAQAAIDRFKSSEE